MVQMVHAEAGPRGRLLDAAVAYVRANGLRDTSLRQLAAALGTSHRMLIYHFGSLPQLVVAIVERIEAEERAHFAALMASGRVLDRAGLLRAMWKRLSMPEQWPTERLFFELYGQALQGRPGTEGMLERVVDDWLDAAETFARANGLPLREARAHARLDLAIVRGLLLDLVATGDRNGVKRAFDTYLALLAPPPAGTPG